MNQGLVIKSTGSWYTVKDTQTHKIVLCTIRGKLRIQGIKSTNPVAVGDYVNYEIPPNTDTGIIQKIRERKNYIVRKSTNLSKQTHILAANIDQTVLIVTLKNPVTYSIFIDRYLITAEAYEIPARLIFNKTDLYHEKEKEQLKEYITAYQLAGYDCIQTSVTQKINLDQVARILKNKTTLIAGNSGVGKSSLINFIDPSLNLKINEISNYHKSGKHTTTFAEMFDLAPGGKIIDTPGIRGFGLYDIQKKELFHYFPEIFKASENCKFYNCTHVHEPGCAVKRAVEQGAIHPMRYNNYLNILFDKETKHRL
ncbi:MAG: ribosome small subunit-dependent GTPase A [Bacteroidales bacterium]|nr:ribosome small subunit-dependent GTPase A [Bacteroidales bacterium]